MSSERMLYIILYLLAIHSFCVGLALIITPAEMFAQFGYQPVTENFFPVQGGVFHLIMSFAYYLAAKNLDRERGLIILTITAKMAATVFLMLYYIFISPIWMVLLSGILDAMMGIIILILFRKFLNKAEKISE
jgi:hypothetical protein